MAMGSLCANYFALAVHSQLAPVFVLHSSLRCALLAQKTATSMFSDGRPQCAAPGDPGGFVE